MQFLKYFTERTFEHDTEDEFTTNMILYFETKLVAPGQSMSSFYMSWFNIKCLIKGIHPSPLDLFARRWSLNGK